MTDEIVLYQFNMYNYINGKAYCWIILFLIIVCIIYFYGDVEVGNISVVIDL